jgi:micrococcal nuclease
LKKTNILLLLFLVPAVFVFTQDDTVYLSQSGAKYHRENCSTLKSTKIPVKLTVAVSQGKTPCSVCKPPELGKAAAAELAAKSAMYRVNAFNLKSYTQVDLKKLTVARVIRHVDGDTVELEIQNPEPPLRPKEKIRMIGVDTPETVHPDKGVEYFGKEASAYTTERLLGKTVFLAFDWDTRDKYDRLLAYIYLADGTCHNADLIKNGYGHAYTRFPFQFLEEFRKLEQDARIAKRGLWAVE